MSAGELLLKVSKGVFVEGRKLIPVITGEHHGGSKPTEPVLVYSSGDGLGGQVPGPPLSEWSDFRCFFA